MAQVDNIQKEVIKSYCLLNLTGEQMTLQV